MKEGDLLLLKLRLEELREAVGAREKKARLLMFILRRGI